MKTIVAILALSTLCVAANPTPRIFENKIKDAINKILTDLKENGIPTMNITSIDPLVYPKLDLAIDNATLATATLNLTDIAVNGLANMEYDYLKFELIKMHLDFKLKWPKVEGKCMYNLTADIHVIPMEPWFGAGPFNFSAEGFEVSGQGHLKLDGVTHVHFTDLTLSLGIDKFEAVIDGFLNDPIFSQTASKAISAAIPNLLDEFRNEISAIISPIAMKKINEVLKDTPIAYLMKYYDMNPQPIKFQENEIAY